MTAYFVYGPVTVHDEANAVGETAGLFAQISQIMRIPLVTSIWRGLAGMDDRLRLGLGVVEPTGRCAITTGASAGLGWCVILPPKRGWRGVSGQSAGRYQDCSSVGSPMTSAIADRMSPSRRDIVRVPPAQRPGKRSALGRAD